MRKGGKDENGEVDWKRERHEDRRDGIEKGGEKEEGIGGGRSLIIERKKGERKKKQV